MTKVQTKSSYPIRMNCQRTSHTTKLERQIAIAIAEDNNERKAKERRRLTNIVSNRDFADRYIDDNDQLTSYRTFFTYDEEAVVSPYQIKEKERERKRAKMSVQHEPAEEKASTITKKIAASSPQHAMPLVEAKNRSLMTRVEMSKILKRHGQLQSLYYDFPLSA